MTLNKQFIFCVSVFLCICSFSYGQSVKQLIPYDGTPDSYFTAQIIADTTATGGLLPDRVYELQGGGIYLNTDLFYVEEGQTLRIVGVGDTLPIIYQYPTGTGANPQNPPGYLFRLRGGNLEMTNVAVTGYFEPIDTNYNNVQGNLIRTDTEGSSIFIDNCIFSNTSGQMIRTQASTKVIKITNTIFTNMGALISSNFGAGKGIDLRESSCDSLIIVNNTFTNYQDRVIRHYNFGNPLEGTGNIGYGLIDHNTIFNGMGFHGLLSLGNIGSQMIITNNLFVDAFAAGEDSSDSTRTEEWGNTGEFYSNGYNRMSWIFSAPNDTTQWSINNNYFAISDSGQAFFDNNPPIVVGSPLSWHINSRLGSDSVTAFIKIDDPDLAVTQELMTNMMRWYISPSGGNRTKNTPSSLWNRETDDFDRRPITYWRDTLDASYSTASPAYTGSVGGFPAGDLNWFPDKKVEWEEFITDVSEKYIPTNFSLEQNYPNPFNPSTKIVFNLGKSAFTSLTVYNILGEKVEVLLSKELSAGVHEVNFDASNLSTGVYLYKLQAGSNVAVKKMMLIK